MNVTTLAQAMNVTEKDVLSLVNRVSTSLEQGGMKDIFLNMNEEEWPRLTQAYVAAELKKFNEFCISLLTNTEKKNAFDLYIFKKLKDENTFKMIKEA